MRAKGSEPDDQHYILEGTPPLTMADTCPPALSAYHLKRAYGEDFAMPNVEKVIDYIKTVERNDLNSIDHLGSNLESLFYPSSIWVDSLMMWVPFYCWLKNSPRINFDNRNHLKIRILREVLM